MVLLIPGLSDLEIAPPASPVIAGADAERLPRLHTNATTDQELLVVWLRSHADSSPHTRRAYARIGRRFLAALAATGADLRRHTIDDVQAALDAMRTREDGTPASGATLNTNIAAVKALLNFAHKVGFSRFNAAPLIKMRKVKRERAQRLLSEVDAHLRLRSAKTGRDRLLLEVAYYGALRVSELAGPFSRLCFASMTKQPRL